MVSIAIFISGLMIGSIMTRVIIAYGSKDLELIIAEAKLICSKLDDVAKNKSL